MARDRSIPLFLKGSIWLAALALFLAVVTSLAFHGESYAEETYRGFPDVPSKEWYASDEVLGYALDNGLVKGYDSGKFGPSDKITRGQIVTILHRMAGSPAAKAPEFEDVDYSLYYGEPIKWARSTGVVSGYIDADGQARRFDPDAPVTREQLAVMLSNYAKTIVSMPVDADGSKFSKMPDSSKVSSWAKDSVSWVIEKGIITGSNGRILPINNATRAEACKMISVLHRDVIGKREVELKEGTKVVQNPEVISDDGTSVQFVGSASDYKVGDIVAVYPTIDHIEGAMLRVTSISEKDDVVSLSGTKVPAKQIIENVRLQGVATCDLANFEPSEGIKALSTSREAFDGLEHSVGKDSVTFAFNMGEKEGDANYSISGSLELSVHSIIYDIDSHRQNGTLKILGDVKTALTVTGSLEHEIPLGSIPLTSGPMGVKVNFILVPTFSGEVTVEAVLDYEIHVSDAEDHFKGSSFEPDFNVQGSAKGSIGDRFSLEAYVFEAVLAEAAIDVGFEATLETQTHTDLPMGRVCPRCATFSVVPFVDVSAALLPDFEDKIEHRFGASGRLIGEDGLILSVSPISRHLENLQVVDRCSCEDSSSNPNDPSNPSDPSITVPESGKPSTSFTSPITLKAGEKITFYCPDPDKCDPNASYNPAGNSRIWLPSGSVINVYVTRADGTITNRALSEAWWTEDLDTGQTARGMFFYAQPPENECTIEVVKGTCRIEALDMKGGIYVDYRLGSCATYGSFDEAKQALK